jgi:hypothetical protein
MSFSAVSFLYTGTHFLSIQTGLTQKKLEKLYTNQQLMKIQRPVAQKMPCITMPGDLPC